MEQLSYRNQARLYEHILESMDNGVIALDYEGKIITFNAAAAQILGIDAQTALGKYYPEVFYQKEYNESIKIRRIFRWLC